MSRLPRALSQSSSASGELCSETAWPVMRYGRAEPRLRWEANHDDGYVGHANGHDVGHGADLASPRLVSAACDSRVHKVPPLVSKRRSPGLVCLPGLRVYLTII